MKKYRVRFNIMMTYDVEVDARSKIEAEELAEDMFDGVDASEYEFDDWEAQEPECLIEYKEPRPVGFYDCAWR